jgi:hypothetical protein
MLLDDSWLSTTVGQMDRFTERVGEHRRLVPDLKRQRNQATGRQHPMKLTEDACQMVVGTPDRDGGAGLRRSCWRTGRYRMPVRRSVDHGAVHRFVV